MGKTLVKEMKDDEDLYQKLSCWCQNNAKEKDDSIQASVARLDELQASIMTLVARQAELAATLEELKDDLARDKKALAEAVAMRKKELAGFNEDDKEAVQNLKSLKGAIIVLSKHHPDGSQGPMAGGKMPPAGAVSGASASFLSSAGDTALVAQVMKRAEAFLQAHHADAYYPAYVAQSGQVLGILQQMKDDIENDMAEAQKVEMQRVAAFLEVKGAKEALIQGNEEMLGQKKEDLAEATEGLANTRLDLAKEKNSLTADQRFLLHLQETCGDADKNWEIRKQARQDEMTAVGEAIQILGHDKARDGFATTWSFVQLGADQTAQQEHRRQASAALRRAAKRFNDPKLAVLATTVELDAFARVKKAIDDMVEMLKTQQADEVKKSDWCKTEFHENEVDTARAEDRKNHLDNKVEDLAASIKTIEEGIAEAKARIAQAHVELQRASASRKAENLDFRRTAGDQATAVEMLHKALDKLASYYNVAAVVPGVDLAQENPKNPIYAKPPVEQKEYKANGGATKVMNLIQKLITEARIVLKDSQTSESNAQAAYEQLIGDTNLLAKELEREVTAKTRVHVKANKEKLLTESDLSDTEKELDGLVQYKTGLHADCDYLLRNLDLRQQARAEEIESLHDAKAVLSGANSS